MTLEVEVWFLDASSHLYNRTCPSVGPSVGPSVRRLVRPSVGDAFVKNKGNHYFRANNCRRRYTRQISCNHIIIQSFNHEDASLALWALFIWGPVWKGKREVKKKTEKKNPLFFLPFLGSWLLHLPLSLSLTLYSLPQMMIWRHRSKILAKSCISAVNT